MFALRKCSSLWESVNLVDETEKRLIFVCLVFVLFILILKEIFWNLIILNNCMILPQGGQVFLGNVSLVLDPALTIENRMHVLLIFKMPTK